MEAEERPCPIYLQIKHFISLLGNVTSRNHRFPAHRPIQIAGWKWLCGPGWRSDGFKIWIYVFILHRQRSTRAGNHCGAAYLLPEAGALLGYPSVCVRPTARCPGGCMAQGWEHGSRALSAPWQWGSGVSGAMRALHQAFRGVTHRWQLAGGIRDDGPWFGVRPHGDTVIPCMGDVVTLWGHGDPWGRAGPTGQDWRSQQCPVPVRGGARARCALMLC